MAEFHSLMALFQVDARALKSLLPQLAPTQQGWPAVITERVLAVEVIRLPRETHIVLVSTADSASQPTHLRCWIAFCNDVGHCDEFRDAGVPVIEAELCLNDSRTRLEVIANHYPKGPLGMIWSRLITIDGLQFEDAGGVESVPGRKMVYHQILPRPDLQRPGFDIVGYQQAWSPARRLMALDSETLTVCFEPAQFPDFNALFPSSTDATRVPDQVFGGWFDGGTPPAAKYSGAPVKLTNAGTVGAPNYRFEDMELLGFRINVPPPADGADDAFIKLVEPLNFHRRKPDNPDWRGIDDFEYRAATRAIVVELIRYGKMKYQGGTSVLGPDTYMSQHELLVRMLVGRVDQDGVQGRNPTTFVQSIFVDNPTSKAVGRDMQGYPKLLGSFCTDATADGTGNSPADRMLRAIAQDGTQGGKRVPLHEVKAVCVATRIPEPELDHNKVLEFEYSIPEFPDDNFNTFNDQWLSSIGGFVGAPWRQDDFDDPIFRRSFARTIVNQGLRRSRSVQVIPVTAEDGEAQTWLTGTFALSRIRVQQPPGIATLTFHRSPGGKDWEALCNLLATLPERSRTDSAPAGQGELPAGDKYSVSLPSGHWYRVKCNMDLTIDDGLAWD